MDEDEFDEAEPIFVDIDFNDMAEQIQEITGFDLKIIEAILYAQDLVQEEVLIETFGECEEFEESIDYEALEYDIDFED